MPDTHHGQDPHIPMQETAGEEPAGGAVPVDAQVETRVAAVDAVVEAEVVEDADAIDAEVATDDGAIDDETAEGEAGEDARPSFKGKKAKPRKEKAPKEKKPRKPRDPKRARHVLMAVIVAVLALILVGTGLFCWQKWMRFDDTADIQGVWKVQATGDTIVFDGRNLKLTRGISYEYRLDTDDKTITYQFGELAGGGSYYFSGDRQMLVIVDGDERLGVLADLGFLPGKLVQDDDADDNATVLAKVSGDTSAEPSGTATGVSMGASTGEREYVVKPEPSTSSSSKKKKSKSSSSEEGEEGEHRGFVDEDGDGYDDETDLTYEEYFDEYLADDEESEDEEGDEELDEDSDGEDEEAWDDAEYDEYGNPIDESYEDGADDYE